MKDPAAKMRRWLAKEKRLNAEAEAKRKLDPWHKLVHQVSSPNALLKRIKAHSTWRRKIGPWLKGVPVDDAPSRNGRKHDTVIVVTTDSIRFIGPFAEVTCQKEANGWLAKVAGCANPVQQHYQNEDKLVSAFCGSTWHTAIRGVIG